MGQRFNKAIDNVVDGLLESAATYNRTNTMTSEEAEAYTKELREKKLKEIREQNSWWLESDWDPTEESGDILDIINRSPSKEAENKLYPGWSGQRPKRLTI